MPFYKDKNNGVHVLEDAAFAYMLPIGCVEITDDEAAVLQAPPPPSAQELVTQQIAALEADSSKPRRQREAILGIDNGWLAGIDAQIATLRAKLK